MSQHPEDPQRELTFEEHVELQLQRAALLGECEILQNQIEDDLQKLQRPTSDESLPAAPDA